MARPAAEGTTKCSRSILIWLALLLAAGPARAGAVSEAELVRAFRAARPQQAAAVAARSQRRAAALTAPYLPHPELTLRREQSLSADTEFSSTVAGLGLTLEIGGRHKLRKQAARLDARSLGYRWRARRLDSECHLRGLARQAHAAEQAVTIMAVSQRRLEGLARDLGRLVQAGERAAFDLQRLRLQVQTHGRLLAMGRARLTGVLAHLGALTGLEVTGVQLDSAPRPPSTSAVPHAVQALRVQAKAEQRRAAALSRRWVPDLGLYGAYRLDTAAAGDPGHGYEVGLTLNLPLTDTGHARRARLKASRQELLARALGEQRRRRALAAALTARSAELNRVLGRASVDQKKLGRDAARRYLKGVSPLSGLLDTLRGLEEAALQRAGVEAALRNLDLQAACARGTITKERP